MPQIIGVGTAVPPYVVYQEQARDFAAQQFRQYLPHMNRLTTIFHHAAVDTRYFVTPADWWLTDQHHSLAERNDIYLREAPIIGQQAIEQALQRAGLTPQDVDNLVVVSSTGIATPSLDALLINRLNMRSNVRRMPLWGLGCAGGVAGLARATEMARVYPDSITVLLAVETCGLTFQFADKSKKNFIATALFADGAAACVIAGDNTGRQGVEVLACQSTLWPDSLRVMGWDVVDEGLAVVFGAEIPKIVADLFRPEVDGFLRQYDLTISEIEHLVFHPGGAKVLDAYNDALALTNGHLNPAREVLRCYGNMSSPTVLFVLDYILQNSKPTPGELGLVAALGPGFSAEQALVRF